MRSLLPSRQVLMLLFTIAVVTGCCVLLANTTGLSTHEILPDFWDFDNWGWPIESNGMLSGLLYKALWDPLPKALEHSDLYIRFPSIALSAVCLFLTYQLGNALARRCASRYPWGTYGTFLLGANVAFLAHSYHKRFYMLNMVLVVATTWLLLEVSQHRTWRKLALYQLALWGCSFSMILSSIIAAPHLLYYTITAPTARERRRALLQSLIIASLTCGSVYLQATMDSAGLNRFNYYDSHEVYSQFIYNGFLGQPYCHPVIFSLCTNDQYDCYLRSTLHTVGATVGIALLMLVFNLVRRSKDRYCATHWLCLVTSIWAILFYEVFSLTVKNICIAPNFSWVLPIWALTLAQAISRPRWVRYMLLVAFLGAVPFTHESILINQTGLKDALRPLNCFRRQQESVLLAFQTFELAHCGLQAPSDCTEILPITQETLFQELAKHTPTIPIPDTYCSHALHYLENLHHATPLRLWVICDTRDSRIQPVYSWLRQMWRTGQIDYRERKQNYAAAIFALTLYPHSGTSSAIRRSAPTPLRGTSTLKFLQQCR